MIEKFKIKNDKTQINLNISSKVFYPTETTKYLLEATIKKISKKKNLAILDLGCGNGVIGIFLLKKFKHIKHITFSDLSLNAVNVTKKNLRLNKISPKKYEVIKSNQFDNLNQKKFDLIINDVSGISSDVAKITSWFKNVPCDSGNDGTKLTLSILKKFSNHLRKNGSLIFPIISFSNENKVLKLIKKLKLNYKFLSVNSWPAPKVLYKNIKKLNKLKKDKKIYFEIKYDFILANTKILFVN